MAKGTPATVALEKAGVAFKLHEYDYDPNAAQIGMQAAEALGVPASRLLKTLMAKAGGAVVCVLIASDREVSLKKLAAAAGAKDAAMLPAAEAERITGYHVGGISPFGQRKRARTFVDHAALGHPTIICNGGRHCCLSGLLRRLHLLRHVVERRDDVLGQRVSQRQAFVRIADQADAACRQFREAVTGAEHAHAWAEP